MKIENSATAAKKVNKQPVMKYTTTVVVTGEMPITEVVDWNNDVPFQGSTTEELAAFVQDIVANQYKGQLDSFVSDWELSAWDNPSVDLDIEYVPGEGEVEKKFETFAGDDTISWE